MGLFNWGSRKKDSENEKESDGGFANSNREVPEDVFIEKDSTANQNDMDVSFYSIHKVYDFLSKDFQQQGYDDALVNPDTSYMTQNMDAIISDLDMVIRRVITFYEDTLMEYDFYIESRGRLGMVDTVDEIKMKKEKAKQHMEKVLIMEQESREKLGASQRIIISYRRGFHNGMAAIAIHESNKRKF